MLSAVSMFSIWFHMRAHVQPPFLLIEGRASSLKAMGHVEFGIFSLKQTCETPARVASATLEIPKISDSVMRKEVKGSVPKKILK